MKRFFILLIFFSFILPNSFSYSLERTQLPESDFSQWHTERLPGFLTFGTKECTEMPGTEPLCWDNGNPAFSASGSTKWPTKRIILQDGSTAALLTTRKVFGVIASGNLFTGRIVRTMGLKQLLGFTDKDGKALIDWGVPFTARPSGFKVKFSYNGLGDECSLVATLENRSLDEEQKTIRKYVATAAYIGKTDSENITNCLTRISEPDDNGLRTLEVDFLYGEYPENANEFPENVTQAEADEEITHVNVVFASSAHGDYFEGIKNASLIVKDFEFIYPEENIQ
ncbi:PCMD domain-containing protein [Treponema sp.]|uniref:PCMD domain-containing protein n=1 Tax=Treponema sp. TaxID=166 RepID=UPI00388F8F59